MISATGNWQCLNDLGTEIPRETRGNTAEIPREVKFLAIAREFHGNGNLNPARKPAEIPRKVKILAIVRREFRGNGNLNPGHRIADWGLELPSLPRKIIIFYMDYDALFCLRLTIWIYQLSDTSIIDNKRQALLTCLATCTRHFRVLVVSGFNHSTRLY